MTVNYVPGFDKIVATGKLTKTLHHDLLSYPPAVFGTSARSECYVTPPSARVWDYQDVMSSQVYHPYDYKKEA